MRASPRLKGGFLFAVVALFFAAGSLVPTPPESLLAGAERLAFDAQMRMLRTCWPRPVDADIVLIGIDADTETAFPEPIALWHRRFAGVLHALAKAAPRAVGIDVVPPERSFDWVMPGSDLAMMRGLLDLKRVAPLVSVQTVNARGEPVAVQANFRAILAPENLGIDQQLKDPDGVSRRYDEHELSQSRQPVPTLAGQLLRHLRMPVDDGFIDYSRGEPIAYVPMHAVAQMDEAQLARTFRGRIVLLGHVTRSMDRWPLPVKQLMANDPEAGRGSLAYTQPGVLVHLQVLRNHFTGGLLHALPKWLELALAAAAALAVLVRARPATLWAIAFVVPVGLLAASLLSIVSARILLPVATLTACFWMALVARGVFDAAEAVVERVRLRQSFEGQVSPAVLSDMLAGTLSPGVSGQLAEVCVLFSDVRDFTTLSEKMPPAVVTTVLQRYFDRMVHAVHRFDGTVDKFIGDGMMVLFGAPRKSADPCGDAVQCALAMMSELDVLNEEFAREGLPTLVIGIGINYGTVTVGNIGSSERHNYSAIGDAVNVAARVEGLTKDLGRKIIITDSVVGRIGGRFHFDPLGSHAVKGHSPVSVWGIRTARVAPVAVQAEAVQ
ncbi:MAG TPA: adenylate/guanylate cyclase domain-containing protein [Usitatibacter sp.]|nr:adenylate/guanylate cyclase domain-containing protein [Usitatibacter sp.]